MVDKTKPAKKPVCRRCGGTLIPDHGVLMCIFCSEEYVSTKDRGQYLQDFKDEILADKKTIGTKKTIDKWKISSSTLWNLAGGKQDNKPAKTGPAPGPSPNGRLPSFPEFSNDWQPEVMIGWFNAYQALYPGKTGGS